MRLRLSILKKYKLNLQIVIRFIFIEESKQNTGIQNPFSNSFFSDTIIYITGSPEMFFCKGIYTRRFRSLMQCQEKFHSSRLGTVNFIIYFQLTFMGDWMSNFI